MLLLIYVLAGAWVVPFHPERLSKVEGRSARVLNWVCRRRKRLAIGFAILSVVLVGMAWSTPSLAFLPDGIVLRTYPVLSMAACVTFAMWKKLALKTQRLLLRSMIALVQLNLLGEVIWVLAHHSSLFSPRNYSIWAILHIFFCVFLFARVIDVWQSYSDHPVRAVAIAVTLIAVGLSGPTLLGRPRPYTLVAGTLQDSETAADAMPAEGRVLREE